MTINTELKPGKKNHQGEGGGRPKRYTKDFIENEAEALLEYIKTATPIPFIKDFAYKRGYTSAEIAHLFVSNFKFLHALNSLRDVQETKLVFGSLTNELNSYMSMNTLKNVAGWRDKHDIEVSGELVLGYGYRKEKTNGHISTLRG